MAGGLLLLLTAALPVMAGGAALRELRGRDVAEALAVETPAAMLDRQLAWRAGRHLEGELPPFLRTMAEQMAPSLAGAQAQGRLLAALHCGAAAPPLLASLAGVAWAGGVELVLEPCLGGADRVRVTLLPAFGGLRVVDAVLAPP